MADQPAYTGATYDKSLYRQEGESLFDYMRRLAELRAKGILGGGGMLDTAVPAEAQNVSPAASQPLGEVVVNQPSSDSSAPSRPITKQEQYEGMRTMMDYPLLAAGARALIPMGLGNLFLRDSQIEANVRNAQNEATGHQGFFDYLFGNEGDVVLGERGAGGSLVTGQASAMPYSASNPYSDGGYFDQLMNEARSNIMGKPTYTATTYPANPMYPNFNTQTMAAQQQMIAEQLALEKRKQELATQMQADAGMLASSSPSDSVNAGRTSSSDISYSSDRVYSSDLSPTGSFDFNKD